jgi:hypothetical protein
MAFSELTKEKSGAELSLPSLDENTLRV